MEGNGNISDYRSKLDRTLASRDLTNYETIHALVKNQILRSLESKLEEYTEHVVEKRSKEMFNFLHMLRSASASNFDKLKSIDESQSGWKAKEDTDEFRVMYREGPTGTPLHTLLVEGYVDGPLDVCLCVSCESDLYDKWWPQSAIPVFKVVQSRCVQKVRIGEQIALVRMKLSWPLSTREALVHFFALDCFQDGLIVVLLNSVSDLESIEKNTHGFTRDGIPDADDVVRIDVVGGFAFKKVTEDRSYFRTIANMDIKLDFVPPALINFISRQLIGSGFKLYKKEIASASKGNDKFREALRDPMYTRIHEALYSKDTSTAPKNMPTVLEAWNNNDSFTQNGNETGDLRYRLGESVVEYTAEEIAEEVETVATTYETGTKQFAPPEDESKMENISPRVREALAVLDKAISILRESGQGRKCDEENGKELYVSSEFDKKRTVDEVDGHEPKNISGRHGSRGGSRREKSQSKIVPGDCPNQSHSLSFTRRKRPFSIFCCFVAPKQVQEPA